MGFDEVAASAASATGFAIGVQPRELRDVLRAELVERRDLEQLHRALDLGAQDRDRLVDAATPAGHEAVEVRAADEREARAERDRRHDVGAGHDARVEVHLHVGADLAHDVRQQVEGDRRAVELAAAVVREHDAVDAACRRGSSRPRRSARP